MSHNNPRWSKSGYRRTAKILAGMLKENTGVNMLDSGFENGRHWQQNQTKDFDLMPAVNLGFYVYGKDGDLSIEFTHNVYAFLINHLIYDENLTHQFRVWSDKQDPDNRTSWHQLRREFVAQLPEVTGLYGEDSPFEVNTYNGDDLLSQVLEYTHFGYKNDTYIMLQIHNGADVRGGYTAPVAFKCYESESLFFNADGTIYCDKCNHDWSTDDAYHWYDQDWDRHSGIPRQLEDYPAIAEDSPEGEIVARRIDHGVGVDFERMSRVYDMPDRFVFVRNDHTAICPICGRGTLQGM